VLVAAASRDEPGQCQLVQAGRPAVGDLAARQRFICLLGMSHYRFNGAVIPPQLVLGFGNLSERTIRQGIAAIGDLLRGQP
jgi:hypothetical protein